jgi:16S rRNA (uracil1498-N3)-methyltransferase
MRANLPHDFVFYAPDFQRKAPTIELAGEEHHHLSRVLRMKTGETVYVSNGTGVLARCGIQEIGRTATRLKVEDVVEDRTDRDDLVLALALLKKDAYERAVEQCTELGVTRFLPFAAHASRFKDYPQAYLERLRRIALSAMKQSFRAILPAIDTPVSFDQLVVRAESFPSVLVGEVSASQPSASARPRPILIVVGPEAGLTSDEQSRLMAAGAAGVSVSRHRLRSETAAAVLSARFAGGPVVE